MARDLVIVTVYNQQIKFDNTDKAIYFVKSNGIESKAVIETKDKDKYKDKYKNIVFI